MNNTITTDNTSGQITFGKLQSGSNTYSTPNWGTVQVYGGDGRLDNFDKVKESILKDIKEYLQTDLDTILNSIHFAISFDEDSSMKIVLTSDEEVGKKLLERVSNKVLEEQIKKLGK